MNCGFCKSEFLFLKAEGDKTGLYCKKCGRWLKWVDPAEKTSVEKQIEKQKRAVQIDGNDVDRVKTQYRKLKEKYKSLNDEIIFLKERISQGGSEIEKKSLYDKAMKLKELGIKINVYSEIFTALGL